MKLTVYTHTQQIDLPADTHTLPPAGHDIFPTAEQVMLLQLAEVLVEARQLLRSRFTSHWLVMGYSPFFTVKAVSSVPRRM